MNSTSAKIWARAGKQRQLRVDCARDAAFSQIEGFAEMQFTPDLDYTAVCELTGLSSSTRYFYRIMDGDRRVAEVSQTDDNPTFETFPPEDQVPDDFSLALGSCFNPFDCDEAKEGGQKVLKYLDKYRDRLGIRFMILVGDQVYSDSFSKGTFNFKRAKQLHQYYQVYQKYWADPDFQRVVRSLPTFMIFDDHEIWNDWGTNFTQDLRNWFTNWRRAKRSPRFEAALKAYHAYQQSHNPDPIPGEKYAYTFQYGRIGFFVLDTRTNRRQEGTPRGYFLGNNQHKALKEWLLKPHFVKFIVSSIPIIHAIGGNDQWKGAKKELREILNYITNKDISGVHFLSGDVHRSHCAKLTRKGMDRPPILSYTSSPLANTPLFRRWPLGNVKGYHKEVFFKMCRCNFGSVRVRNDNGRPLVSFSVYDDNGHQRKESHFV